MNNAAAAAAAHLQHALFPTGLPDPDSLIVAVEHGPDELAPHLLRALGRPDPICVHTALHAGARKLPPNVRSAVLPAESPAAQGTGGGGGTRLLRAARHVLVVSCVRSGGASDVHGTVHVAKVDGRWVRGGGVRTYRFRLTRDGATLVH